MCVRVRACVCVCVCAKAQRFDSLPSAASFVISSVILLDSEALRLSIAITIIIHTKRHYCQIWL